MVQEMRKVGIAAAITSTTGLSSLNYQDLGGTTIHHWSGIRDGHLDARELAVKITNDESFHSVSQRIRNVQCLFVDEIGMLSQRTFEQIEFVCRTLRETDKLFGGIQVVACGSFKQLQPVPNLRIDDFGIHCFKSMIFQVLFPHHVHLQHVFRQVDPRLIVAINELCEGSPSHETHTFLRSLQRPLVQERAENPVYLYGTNFDVNFHNITQLHKHNPNTETTEYKAMDSGQVSLLHKCAAPKMLSLKTGCPVILVATVNSRLVNGMRGTVTAVSPEGPVIDFGKLVVKLEKHRFSVYDRHIRGFVACREQYPLRLAYALTVHRAQGQTIENLVVDCFGFFVPGQMGVAIGRAVDCDGIRIVSYNPEAAELKHKDSVYDFYFHASTKPAEDLSCCQGVHELELQVQMDASDETGSEVLQSGHIHVDEERQLDAVDEVACTPTTTAIQPCPWDVTLLMGEIFNLNSPETERQKSIASVLRGVLSLDGFRPFIDKVYSDMKKTCETFGGNPKDKDAVVLCQQVHRHCTENTHLRVVWSDICSSQAGHSPSMGSHIFAKIIWAMCQRICHEKAGALIEKQIENEAEATNKDLQEDLPVPVLAKIRYIAGACVTKVTQRTRARIERIGTKPTAQHIRQLLYQQQKVLQVLRISESHALATTKDQSTMEEITYRQNASHGLCHVSDEVLDFFVCLYKKAQILQNKNHLHLDIENILSISTTKLLEDTVLLDKWFSLFTESVLDKLGMDIDEDLLESMMIDNFSAVVSHFSRIHLSEAVHQLKEDLPRKKKQALRPSLESATKRPGSIGSNAKPKGKPTSSKRKAQDGDSCDSDHNHGEARSSYTRKSKSVAAASFKDIDSEEETEVADTYPCGMCQDDPDTDEDASICCDTCQLWFHYKCVNITGSERFLSSNKKWYCPKCDSQSQGQGKGTKVGRGKGKGKGKGKGRGKGRGKSK